MFGCNFQNFQLFWNFLVFFLFFLQSYLIDINRIIWFLRNDYLQRIAGQARNDACIKSQLNHFHLFNIPAVSLCDGNNQFVG